MDALFFYIRQAIQEMKRNGRLNLMTILTISLCTLMMGALILFYRNGSHLFSEWMGAGRLIVYLSQDSGQDAIDDVRQRIEAMAETVQVEFISKKTALENLKSSLPNGDGLLTALEENPLPDAFIVTQNGGDSPKKTSRFQGGGDLSTASRELALFARKLSNLPHVASVSYGQDWFSALENFRLLFIVSSGVVIAISLLVILFVVGNTVKLSLFARHEEFIIMRLVGATERFMAYPFYLCAMFQGAVGTALGLGTLQIIHQMVKQRFTVAPSQIPSAAATVISTIPQALSFLPMYHIITMLIAGTLLGWLGSFFAIQTHLKR